MKLGKFIKSPVERKRYSIDYSAWLDSGEKVESITFSVSPSTSSNLVVDAYSIPSAGTSVTFFVNAGLDGRTYTIDVVMHTSGGQIKEDQILFSVRSA